MRRGKLFGMLLIVALAGSGSILADEVVHFSNGTFMPIRSHKVDGNMVHVSFGAESEMAFPIGMVERIESGGRNIVFKGLSANVVTSSPDSGDGVAGEGAGETENTRTYAVDGGTAPAGTAAQRAREAGRTATAANPNGIAGFTIGNRGAPPATTRPFANSNHPVKRKIAVTGDPSIRRQRTIGAAGGSSADDGLRGARLVPGGSKAQSKSNKSD